MYPQETEVQTPFGSPYQPEMEVDFGYNIDPSLLDEVSNSPTPNMVPDQAWSSPYLSNYDPPAQNMYPTQPFPPRSSLVEQAIMSQSQRPNMNDPLAQNGNGVHATVSPAQLFQAPPRVAHTSRLSPVSSNASSAVKKEPRARKASVPIKGEPVQRVGQSSTARLAPKREPSSASSSPPVSVKKESTEITGFDKLKKDYLNPNAKYGWHGRFEEGKPNPLDELTKAISDKKIDMNAAQVAEFASLASLGIPSLYTRNWKTHDAGLNLLSSLLTKAADGMTASPSSKWVEASYKLIDLLKKISPELEQLVQYGLVTVVKRIKSTDTFGKDLRKYAKEALKILEEAAKAVEEQKAAEAQKAGQKRSASDVESDGPTAKKPKVEGSAGSAMPAPTKTKTVVKVVAKKSNGNGADLSALGLTAPKVTKAARPAPKDAVGSLLSSLNPTVMNGQANAKLMKTSNLDSKILRANGKPRKTVSFKPEADLVMIKWIENRDSDEYESGGANTTQMEGEGKAMKEHGSLEEQQAWYEPLFLDEIAHTEPESPALATLKSFEGASAILDENSENFFELINFRDNAMHNAYEPQMDSNPEPAQAVASSSGQSSDLQALLKKLTQGGDSPAQPGPTEPQAPNPVSSVTAPAAPPIHLDMRHLSNILSAVGRQPLPVVNPAQPPYQPPMGAQPPSAFDYNQYDQAPQGFGYNGYNSYQNANAMPYPPQNSWAPPTDEGQGYYGTNQRQAGRGRREVGKDAGKCFQLINHGRCRRPNDCPYSHDI